MFPQRDKIQFGVLQLFTLCGFNGRGDDIVLNSAIGEPSANEVAALRPGIDADMDETRRA